MSNDTTTDDPKDTQPQEGQAEGTIEQSADSLRTDQASETQEPEAPQEDEGAEDNSQNQENSDQEEVPSDDLKEWAKKKGIDPDDTEAVLKLARDTEKGFRQYSQKAKAETNELKQKVSNSSEFGESEAVIQEARVINFYNSNPDARNYDKEMGDIYARFQQSDPEFAGHLVRHLDTLYAMAKSEKSTEEVQTARKQGKVEATQAIKKAQTASSPRMNATSSAPAQTGWNQERVNQVIEEGKYDQYREEILNWERSQY